MKTIPILLALTLCGCSTAYMKNKHDRLHARHDAPLPEGTGLLEDIPMESNASVSRGADYKAYPVSRYVDAGNKDVMHERHVIYRRERPETWRLRPDRGKGILLGPTVGLRNPVALDRPVSQELNAELNRQKVVSRELLALRNRAEDGDAQARQLLNAASKMDRQSDEMLSQIQSYNSQLKEMRGEIDSLKERPERVEVSPTPRPETEESEEIGPDRPLIDPDVKRGELLKEGSESGIQR